ncbi:MAG: hypothetical protein JNM63_07255, partial [Spirochaetia bacterium]|nr:hypothetical protein [Spirochaetia bacterium]
KEETSLVFDAGAANPYIVKTGGYDRTSDVIIVEINLRLGSGGKRDLGLYLSDRSGSGFAATFFIQDGVFSFGGINERFAVDQWRTLYARYDLKNGTESYSLDPNAFPSPQPMRNVMAARNGYSFYFYRKKNYSDAAIRSIRIYSP